MDKIIAIKAAISFKHGITNVKENNYNLKPLMELTVIGVAGLLYQSDNNKIIVSDNVVETKFAFTPETLNEFIAQLIEQKKKLDESTQKAKLINDFIAESGKSATELE
jgi:hypothetical protein